MVQSTEGWSTYFTVTVSSRIVLPSVAVDKPCGIRAACCCAVTLCLDPPRLCGYADANATSEIKAQERMIGQKPDAQHKNVEIIKNQKENADRPDNRKQNAGSNSNTR